MYLIGPCGYRHLTIPTRSENHEETPMSDAPSGLRSADVIKVREYRQTDERTVKQLLQETSSFY